MQSSSTKKSSGEPTPVGDLVVDVGGIVNRVIDRFPSVVAKLVRPYADKLTGDICSASDKFVRAVVREEISNRRPHL